MLKVPEPGRALVDLDRYVRSLHSSSGYFSTLLENPATTRFLVKILGESRFFTSWWVNGIASEFTPLLKGLSRALARVSYPFYTVRKSANGMLLKDGPWVVASLGAWNLPRAPLFQGIVREISPPLRLSTTFGKFAESHFTTLREE